MTDAGFVAAVLSLLLFPVAMFAMLKALWHLWFVVTGVRSNMRTRASLLGPFFVLFPSILEPRAQEHYRKAWPWLWFAIVLLLALFGLTAFADAQP